MKKIAILNSKGGSGKSVALCAIATALARPPYEKNILVLDCDPQHGIVNFRNQNIQDLKKYDIYKDYGQDLMNAVLNQHSFELVDLSKVFSRNEEGQFTHHRLDFDEYAYEKDLSDYDYVFFDFKGSEELYDIYNYLEHMDYVLVPVGPEDSDRLAIINYCDILIRFNDKMVKAGNTPPEIHLFMTKVEPGRSPVSGKYTYIDTRKCEEVLLDIAENVQCINYLNAPLSKSKNYTRADTRYSLLENQTTSAKKLREEVKTLVDNVINICK